MKKTLIAISILAAASMAMATPFGPVGTVSGSATSSVGGSVGSTSVVTAPNQTSAHGAFATSSNETVAGAYATPGDSAAWVGTSAATLGKTTTGAGGIGAGGAGAYAAQSGYGAADATATVVSNKINGSVSAFSDAGVFTTSGATVTNSGLAASGSAGGAFNVTHAAIDATSGKTEVTSNATGGTLGLDGVTTTGGTIGGNETVTATGQSGQSGLYNGNITSTFTTPVNNNDHNNDNHGGGGSDDKNCVGSCGLGNSGNGTGNESNGNR